RNGECDSQEAGQQARSTAVETEILPSSHAILLQLSAPRLPGQESIKTVRNRCRTVDTHRKNLLLETPRASGRFIRRKGKPQVRKGLLPLVVPAVAGV